MPISGASVTITDTTTLRILNYAITDAKGKYSIKIVSELATLKINVKKIDYAFVSEEIANKTQQINFTLNPQVTELKEVTVVASPIRKRGDTLSYNVEAFADPTDRSIADVLAKMPGIEVKADGTVFYQGNAIQKYYIEGLDLLEGKYNLANNNLPHNAVASVQILENHQPIKLLDSLVKTEKASLNIKLKKDITTTGIAKLGAGLSPLLWEVNTTPMVFNKKRQLIFSYQTNNVGHDVSQEIKTLTIENLFEQLDNPTQKTDLLSIIPLRLPNIASNRYLDNRVNMLSANFLTRLKKDIDIRLNVSYLNDYQRQQGENTTEYFLTTENVLLNEKISNRTYTNDLQTNLTIEKNTKETYLKNSFKTQINWDRQQGNIGNNFENIEQNLANPYYLLTNQLKLVKTIGKQVFTIYSFLNYNQSPQSLTVTPGQFAEVLNSGQGYQITKQSINREIFQTNNYIEFTRGLKSFTLTSKIGFSIQHLNKESQITVNDTIKTGIFENRQENNSAKLYFQPHLSYKKEAWLVSLQFPIVYHTITISDKIFNQDQRNDAITINPNFRVRYEINPSWKVGAGLGYNNSFQNTEQILSGYLLNNYRNLQRTNYPVAQNNNYTFSTNINYADPVEAIFFNSSYLFSKIQNPFLPQNEIQANGTQVLSFKDITNRLNFHSSNSKISKYFRSLKTTLTLGLELSYQQGNQLVNNVLLKTINQNIKPNLKVSTRLTDNLSIDYQLETNFNQNRTTNSSRQSVFMFTENLKISIYPSPNQYIGFIFEHYYNDFLSEKRHNLYTDLLYRYTFSTKKIDLELVCTNLLNENKYISSSFTNFYFYQSAFHIRPRQFLASVKFNF
ncbi:hypothetical protein SAMN04488541_100559 [Thermoflexibacter ruber]|uniref:Carboxypeptidase regulatory-like domain-containing protein n=2 Tax=Thermoflexibacter ruber TaxID=1003 RepID=A0A1I2CL80_9BACT|nr:hypothetical protein SAMN04488541_100559 [Thermoflexibacter ruber]